MHTNPAERMPAPDKPVRHAEIHAESTTALALRHGRRVVITIVGATLMLIGVALLVLPGPGLLVIAGGLALLATEFVWARRWLKKIKERSVDVANAFMGKGEQTPP